MDIGEIHDRGWTLRAITFRFLGILFVITCGFDAARASDIEGTIVIKHKLTKRKVTEVSSSYERGIAVKLGSEDQADPMAFERSRVVVYLEGQLPSKPATAIMAQKERRFYPETLVVPVGSTISFPNEDRIFHNVFSLSSPKSFDLGNYPKDHTRTVTFAKPGIVFVNCHLHPNMSAAIVVSPNQWSAKADADGHFVLPDVPPGNYTVVAWHRAAGYFRTNVNVAPDHASQVRFFIPLEAEDGGKVIATR